MIGRALYNRVPVGRTWPDEAHAASPDSQEWFSARLRACRGHFLHSSAKNRHNR
jgi:hypothetical protein